MTTSFLGILWQMFAVDTYNEYKRKELMKDEKWREENFRKYSANRELYENADGTQKPYNGQLCDDGPHYPNHM